MEKQAVALKPLKLMGSIVLNITTRQTSSVSDCLFLAFSVS